MAKKLMDKFKEGVSVNEVENFARKYMMEVLSALAIVVGAVSSMYDFFTGPKLSIFFLAIGVIAGIFASTPIEKALKQFYSFSYKQEKMTRMVLGLAKVAIGLFVPFILFGAWGLIAGTSYHFYTRQAQMSGGTSRSGKGHKGVSGEEHD